MNTAQFLSFVETGQIKGLTLWQPWASLVASSDKRIETRSWGTAYRGLLLIHAALKPYQDDLRADGALHHATLETLEASAHLQTSKAEIVCGMPILPRRAVVAVARLKHCLQHDGSIVRVDEREMLRDFDELADLGTKQSMFLQLTDKERQFGNYTAGRFAWYFDDVTPLQVPVLAKGGQRLWNPTPAVIAAVAKEIEKGSTRQ